MPGWMMYMAGNHIGTVREEVLTFLPRFALYLGDQYMGQIKKEFTFFKPRFTLDCGGCIIRPHHHFILPISQ